MDEIEKIEGGDAAGDALEFTDFEAKKKEVKSDETSLDETLPSDEKESGKLPPTDWSLDQEGADLDDYTGDDEEESLLQEAKVDEEDEEEEKVEEIEEKKEETERKEEPSEEDKAVQEVLKYIEGKTTIKVKGEERDISDMSPEEIRVRIQKGDRFYQGMEEVANLRKEVEKERESVNRGAEQVQRLMNQYGTPRQEQREAQLPKELQPHDNDTDEVRGLKTHVASLTQAVQNMQSTQAATQQNLESDQMVNEVNGLVDDYPLASREEVLAMKAVRPDISTRELMEVSHNHYGSKEFMDKYFEVNPDRLRELKEAHQIEFLATKQKTAKKSVARKKSSSTASSKVHEKKVKTPRTFDEIEAMLPQTKRAYEEQFSGE